MSATSAEVSQAVLGGRLLPAVASKSVKPNSRMSAVSVALAFSRLKNPPQLLKSRAAGYHAELDQAQPRHATDIQADPTLLVFEQRIQQSRQVKIVHGGGQMQPDGVPALTVIVVGMVVHGFDSCIAGR
jgi:hypothetical protein